ncbi:hypothetical protein GY15_24055 [Delftia sp. 670]|nr:hypothetical protein GY15_24055 [Delftia sp. 670]
MAMASRALKASGRRISQSPFTRACWASPPQWVSPTPQPLSSTASPGWKRASSLSSTVPARSMPGTMGNWRTTGERPVMASASL